MKIDLEDGGDALDILNLAGIDPKTTERGTVEISTYGQTQAVITCTTRVVVDLNLIMPALFHALDQVADRRPR